MYYESGLPTTGTPKKEIILAEQPSHDDFLDTMKKVFSWSKLFGIIGPTKGLWRVYGILLLLLVLAIQIGAVYKLIKLLAGLTVYSVGNRSVTARLAGVMFYTTTLLSLILSWRFSSNWGRLALAWAAVERKSTMIIPPDTNLKRRMLLVILFMAVFSAVEHIMSMVSQVDFDTPPSLILQTYILSSHGFILVPTDYSVWIAIPVFFMSNIATILWNFQDLLIVLISMGLSSRYRRLTICVEKTSQSDKKEENWTKNTEILKVYAWRKIREAYVKQAMLVRKVDQALGALVLLSSSENFYFICLQLFLGITQGITGSFIKRMYYLVSLFWLLFRFSFVVLKAADVNVHSKKALRFLHGCVDRCYNIEIERLQKQLTKEYIALSGVGFFSLDRSILLQMAGAVITYELVLIQFEGKTGAAEHVALNITK